MKDLRFLQQKDWFLKFAFRALEDHFPSRGQFEDYFNAIETDDRKNSFLRTASFYLLLVKRGDWKVNVSDSKEDIDYLTNTYKYISIFSLIESLSGETFLDFYQFLRRRRSKIQFPISDAKRLERYYRKYKEEFGSIRRCIAFFKALSPERQRDLVGKLEIKGSKPSIELVATFLYELRSKFVHEGNLVLHMSEGITIGMIGKKPVVSSLSIKDAMVFFEEGLIAHFRSNSA